VQVVRDSGAKIIKCQVCLSCPSDIPMVLALQLSETTILTQRKKIVESAGGNSQLDSLKNSHFPETNNIGCKA